MYSVRGKTSLHTKQVRGIESGQRDEVGAGGSEQLPAQGQAVGGAAGAPDAPISQALFEEACEGGRS